MNSTVRVIEIGHIVAGPSAGLIFSELGYDVIKIERPNEGDIARRLTESSSGAFPFYNRNKRSLALDLGSEKGKEVFLKLVGTSDIIIDNLGYGAMAKMGLSYETLSNHNPRIIYVSIKGYGSGPLERRKSLDFPIEIHSGIAYMTGLTGRPMRLGGSIVDMGAAMFGVIQALHSLLEREQTGNGKLIDIGLFETAMFFMGQHIATYQINGRELKPLNEEGFAWAIYNFFGTKDGKQVFIAVTTDSQWKTFCKEIGLGICERVDLEKNEGRFQKRAELESIISEKTTKMNEADLVSLLERINVPFSILKKPWELLRDEQAILKLVEENYLGFKLRVPSLPGGGVNIRDPPALGSNNEEIIRELGYVEKLTEGSRTASGEDYGLDDKT